MHIRKPGPTNAQNLRQLNVSSSSSMPLTRTPGAAAFLPDAETSDSRPIAAVASLRSSRREKSPDVPRSSAKESIDADIIATDGVAPLTRAAAGEVGAEPGGGGMSSRRG